MGNKGIGLADGIGGNPARAKCNFSLQSPRLRFKHASPSLDPRPNLGRILGDPWQTNSRNYTTSRFYRGNECLNDRNFVPFWTKTRLIWLILFHILDASAPSSRAMRYKLQHRNGKSRMHEHSPTRIRVGVLPKKKKGTVYFNAAARTR